MVRMANPQKRPVQIALLVRSPSHVLLRRDVRGEAKRVLAQLLLEASVASGAEVANDEDK